MILKIPLRKFVATLGGVGAWPIADGGGYKTDRSG
jgi:hypothetical protein